jgi:hypothetical protein
LSGALRCDFHYFEGHRCPLARFGHSRDERSGNPIVCGLLTNAEGCPIAVEVFPGNTADPKTVAAQVRKLRERFGLQRLMLVGDRGMLTSARIREDLQPVPGLEWITALQRAGHPETGFRWRAATVPSLFDQTDLAEITHQAFPGERTVACRNPLLAAERSRKRGELLAATEKGTGEGQGGHAAQQSTAARQRADRRRSWQGAGT